MASRTDTSGLMEEPGVARDRPTIEERASKLDQVHADGNDRYTSLIDVLSRGRSLPPDSARPRLVWHPILWQLVRVILVVIVVYLAVLYGWRWWRQQQTDTWTGPTATVPANGGNKRGWAGSSPPMAGVPMRCPFWWR